jgi:hypothetical protein
MTFGKRVQKAWKNIIESKEEKEEETIFGEDI